MHCIVLGITSCSFPEALIYFNIHSIKKWHRNLREILHSSVFVYIALRMLNFCQIIMSFFGEVNSASEKESPVWFRAGISIVSSIKVEILWEGHKNLKTSPTMFWHYNVVSKQSGFFFFKLYGLLTISELYSFKRGYFFFMLPLKFAKTLLKLFLEMFLCLSKPMIKTSDRQNICLLFSSCGDHFQLIFSASEFLRPNWWSWASLKNISNSSIF